MPPALFSIMDFNIIILVTIHKFIEPGGGRLTAQNKKVDALLSSLEAHEEQE
jgi:hypothetical protein